jgi:hypothetical protein
VTYSPYPAFFDSSTASGRHAAASAGVNTLNDTPNDDDPYSIWLSSPVGQAWNNAQEAAAAQARKQADDEMARAHQSLKLQAQQLAQQGRYQDAQILLSKGEQEIARKRLEAETQINQQRLALDTELGRGRLGLDTELGRGRLALDQQNFGLDYAKTAAQFESGPDMAFMWGDFQDALGRIGAGQPARAYGSTGTPTARTYADFQALAGSPPPSGSGYTPPPGAVGTAPPTPTGTGSVADPRITAATAVMKAIPPTDDPGHDESSRAALAALENIYRAQKPGTYQRLASRPGLLAASKAGYARAGYMPDDVFATMKTWNPGQQSPLAA